MPPSDFRPARRLTRPRGCDPRPERISHVTRIPLPACHAHYPGGPDRVHASVPFPAPYRLPRKRAGSASTTHFSRPSRASLALRPAGSLVRPRRPLSPGFDPAGYPTKPPVS